MPPPTIYDLSSRHFPDVSDSSFSFQIPGSSQDTYLLAEDGLDFFNGADLTRGTPQISPVRRSNRLASRWGPTPGRRFETENANFIERKPSPYKQPASAIAKEVTVIARTDRPESSKQSSGVLSNPRFAVERPTRLAPVDNVSIILPKGVVSAKRDHRTDVPLTCTIDRDSTGAEGRWAKGGMETTHEKNMPSEYAFVSSRRAKDNVLKLAQDCLTTSREPSSSAETQPSYLPRRVEEHSGLPPSAKSSHSADFNGDESSVDMTMGLANGAAERLVQYSQNLIYPFGPRAEKLNTSNTNSHDKDNAGLTNPSRDSDDPDEPITLSQNSLRKRLSSVDVAPTPPASTSTSFVTSAGKRPASVASEIFCRKKSRTQGPSTASTSSSSSISLNIRDGRRGSSSKEEVSRLSNSRRPAKDTETLRKKTDINATSRRISTIQSKQISGDNGVALTRLATSSSSLPSTNSKRGSQESQLKEGVVEQSGYSSSLAERTRLDSSSKMPEQPVMPTASLRDANYNSYTKQQQLASRGKHGRRHDEAPQASSQSRSQRKYRHPIPDYRAMHAAQEAKLALLKENIHPTVPQPIMLETDRRLLERQKFDDMVKEKQREHERLMEEKRKEREEQEERELRELRKKAIPKAHSVPEWYKEAPKKKDKHAGSLGR